MKKNISIEAKFVYLLLIISVLVFVVQITFLLIRYNKCTTHVSAKIIDYEIKDYDINTYSPIYEFEYNNTKYTVSGRNFEEFSKSKAENVLGDIRTLKIDPNNPKIIFYFDNINFGVIIMSSISIIICVCCIIKKKKTHQKQCV